jgi:hypothetical protein
MTIMVAGDVSQLQASMMGGVKSVGALENAAVRLTSTLLDEERVLRMGAAAAYDYKLALAGVDKTIRDELTARRAAISTLKEEEVQRKQTADAAKAAADAAANSNLDRARAVQEEMNNAMAKGKAIADSLLTPVERYKREIAELDALLRKGAIDQETFNRAQSRAKNNSDEGGLIDRLNSPLEKLKAKLGARGPLKDLFEIAVGGGAFAGLQFASQTLGQIATKADDVVTEFRLGKKTAGETADELARQLPYLGGIYTAGQAIRDLFTGERAEIERINEQLKVRNDLMDAAAKFKIDQTGFRAGIAKDIEDLKYQSARAQAELLPRPQRTKVLFDLEFAHGKGEIEAKAKAELAAATKDAKASLDAANKALADLRQPDRITNDEFTQIPVSELNRQNDEAMKKFQSDYDTLTSAIATANKTIKQETDSSKQAVADNITALAQSLGGESTLPNVRDLTNGLQALHESALGLRDTWRTLDLAAPFRGMANQIKIDVMTPLEKFRQEMARLQGLKSLGFLDAETFRRAGLKAKDDLASSLKTADPIEIKAAFATTSDAQIGTGLTDAIANHFSAGLGGKIDNDIQKQTLAEIIKLVRVQEDLSRKIKVGAN